MNSANHSNNRALFGLILGLLAFGGSIGPALGQCPLSQTLANPSATADDNFGISVAISGNLALVGTFRDDTGAANAGSAYLYNATTGAIVQTFNNPSPGATDLFGYAVAISGNNVLIGALNDMPGGIRCGSAYLFDAATGSLLQTFNNPTPQAGDDFGRAVAVSGNDVIVGSTFDSSASPFAGSVYQFDASTGSLVRTINNPTPAITDFFGDAVAVSGGRILVGANSDNTAGPDAGCAYLFDASTGGLLQTIQNPIPANIYFGLSVSLAGNYALIGSFTGAGRAHLYDAATGLLLYTFANPYPASTGSFGVSVSVSGNNVLIGSFDDASAAAGSGAAYLFDAPTGLLLQSFANPSPAVDDHFGGTVGISGDMVVVGANYDDDSLVDAGAAYVFGCVFTPLPSATPSPIVTASPTPTPSPTGSPSPTPTATSTPTATDSPSPSPFPQCQTLMHTFNNPDPIADEENGFAVAIDGNTAVVGEWRYRSGPVFDTGAAHVIDVSTGQRIRTFINPNFQSADEFGHSVAISGNYVLVGAAGVNSTEASAGSAYLFDLTTGFQVQTFDNPVPALGAFFGYSVAISGAGALIGVPFQNSGMAYLYDVPSGLLLHTFNNPEPGVAQDFGAAVAISGNNILIGAPFFTFPADNSGKAYLFDATTGGLTHTLSSPSSSVSDFFGYSVSIDGDNALVGAYGDDADGNAVGKAFVFDSGTGLLSRSLPNPLVEAFSDFGLAVAISGDLALIGSAASNSGASASGRAFLFNWPTGTLLGGINNPTPETTDYFGWSVAISGESYVIGAQRDNTGGAHAGSAYIFACPTPPPLNAAGAWMIYE